MRRINRTFVRIFLKEFVTLVWVSFAFHNAGIAVAQGTNLGTIRGTVADSNGALVAGARVKVTDLATDLVREVTTDSEGNYEVTGLKYGNYRVSVTAQGFKTASANQVALRGGDIVRTDALTCP